MPSKSRASDTDAIAIGLSAGKREIERAFRGDDRDRARTRMRRIGDEFARRLGKLPGELLFLGRLRILLLGREVEKREKASIVGARLWRRRHRAEQHHGQHN